MFSYLFYTTLVVVSVYVSTVLSQRNTDTVTPRGKPSNARRLFIEQGSPVHAFGKPFKIFSKHVKVFDLYFLATEASPDEKLLHAASVLYQYIDNDDDGIPDNSKVYAGLLSRKAAMVMFADYKEMVRYGHFFKENRRCKNILIENIEAAETLPGSLMPDKFDESLEECFHLLTLGYGIAYPDVFGLNRGSTVSRLLDCARGGYFKTPPKKYPDTAWFRYYDKSCNYRHMIVEYIYWAMTTILGAQQCRREEIEDEWRPFTRSELKKMDNGIFTLLTNPKYKLPTKLPEPLHVVVKRVHPCSDSSSDSSTDSSSDEK